MSPVMVDGRLLGVADNGFFTQANTAPIPGGRLWSGNDQDVGAAHAWNDARAAYIAAGGAPGDFMPNGPDSSARSRAAQDWFWSHQPPAAAHPYTSNHGWGLAVDVRSRAAAAWLMQNGHRFCLSHDEGARVGEWWHFRYVGGYRPRRDGLAHLTATERRWCRELDKLRHQGRDPDRQRVLVRELTRQRKRIWQAAQQSGWSIRQRRARYRSLLARTDPHRVR